MKDYDLEEAARQYRDEFLDKNDNDISKYDIEDIFIAGANWQYEQFEKERLKHCDELTAEQAQIESDFIVQHLKKCNRTPTFIDAIEYGRKQMIDKACEWLNDYAYFYVNDYTGSLDEKALVEQFRKVMEE